MIVRLLFSLLLFFTILNIVSAQEILSGKVIIKFREHSVEFEDWLNNNRSGVISTLKPILGNHTSVPYVRDAVLQAIHLKKQSNTSLLRTSYNSTLERIAIIEYKDTIDPFVLSSKLKSYTFIEYAEPVYKRSLLFTPNDSLFQDQYWIRNIKVPEAIDIIPPNSSVIIAITDTGVDYTHPDLAQNIWVNPGEDGKDNSGNDKRSNGIDDDKNGFIDDWTGWDFMSNVANEGDNNPLPGHLHGTHVAGIAGAVTNNRIGIAGTNPFAKILPIKISTDQPSESVAFGHEAILYAAAVGAQVINCSWGNQGYQESEREAVKEAVLLGAVVVAASGNSGINGAFYPAAYPEALSVASVKSDDVRSSFSNFHNTVDISAPGQNIISTILSGDYGYNSGTSMASPCAAAVVGMAKIMYPDYTPEQISEHIKATTDNIDTLNKEFVGLLGTGRVNAYKAVAEKNVRAIRLLPVSIIEEFNDGIYEAGETITVDLTVKNVLAPLANATMEVLSPKDFTLPILNGNYTLGKMGSLEEKSLQTPCSFTIPNNCPPDFLAVFPVIISDTGNFIRMENFTILLNPTYRTINGNNITLTVNSRGNLCYNDYPNNTQGVGIRWKNGSNLCYEAGLITGSSYDSISNVVRGSQSGFQNRDFAPIDIFQLTKPGSISSLDGATRFSDKNSITRAGLDIEQKTYQFNTPDAKDMVFINYRITNNTNKKLDSIYFGLFFDWDIGPAGDNNYVGFDNQYGFGLCYNVEIDSLPAIAVQLTTPQQLNYTAVDNGVSLHNGFTLREKWNSISRGVLDRESAIGDASMIIGAGNIVLDPNESTDVGFVIGVSEKVTDLKELMKSAQNTAKERNIASGFLWQSIPPASSITNLFPNPVDGNEISLTLNVTYRHNIIIELYDAIGQLQEIVLEETLNAGTFQKTVSLNGYSSGTYFIRLKQNGGNSVIPLQID